jgi:hypothetical protein
MFDLHFNELEKERLLSYASHTIRDKLHWGDGEVIIPEEQILEQRIQETEYHLTLDFEQMKLLTNWFLDDTDEGLLLAGEDISILHKMIELLTTYHDELKREYAVKLRMLKAQIEAADDVLTRLQKIVPDTDKKTGVDKTQDKAVDEPVFDGKVERISKHRKEVEEYNEELIQKFKEERVDKQNEEVKDQGINLEREQKTGNFEEKSKRAKQLKKEMQRAEDIAKTAKKKAKGKNLF